MPDRSGFATTTLGAVFWGERLGAKLAALRLSREPSHDIGALHEGSVARVRGVVRSIGEPIAAPLSGRPSVFGRVLACLESTPGPDSVWGRPARGQRSETLTRADVSYGGRFAIEDATGRAIVEIAPDDLFELFVLVRRQGPWNRTALAHHLRAFVRTSGEVALDVDIADQRTVLAEWVVEVGQPISVVARVVRLEPAPSEGNYRSVRYLPVLGPRRERPILLFE